MIKQKIVLKVTITCKTSVIMAAVAEVPGIDEMTLDVESCKLTVIGVVDPVCIVKVLRKIKVVVCIESVNPHPPPKPPEEKPKEKSPETKKKCPPPCPTKCTPPPCPRPCWSVPCHCGTCPPLCPQPCRSVPCHCGTCPPPCPPPCRSVPCHCGTCHSGYQSMGCEEPSWCTIM
ncbi:uncharacterized protein [Elaeis guineensis]|uniref:Heavy metal-associated isoprenylated plant protein 43 n=1 Tax=Elaeis guineensis var. tenera TaxID=51953 RepID=A0A6J0PDZ6_ELAGV|nr:heavy metal-associated isoprenylated plant protein 43 [Elaeis guineensis]